MKPASLMSTHVFNLHRRRAAFIPQAAYWPILVLATLAAIVIPKMAGRSQQAKVTAAASQISNIEMALDAFEVDNGYYPKTGALNELIDQPGNAPNWKGPYLSKGVPFDPWGNNYVYDYPGKHNNNGFDLMSPGPDGRAGTDDDLTNWDKR